MDDNATLKVVVFVVFNIAMGIAVVWAFLSGLVELYKNKEDGLSAIFLSGCLFMMMVATISAPRDLSPVWFLGLISGATLLGGLGFLLYFMPALIAVVGSPPHKNSAAIITLNLLLGWTFLGWVAALVWSLTRD
jgi:hypothetical protein